MRAPRRPLLPVSATRPVRRRAPLVTPVRGSRLVALLALLATAVTADRSAAQSGGAPPAPDPTAPVGRTADGAIVPTHQVLRPAGAQVEFAGRPTDLALLDGGALLAIKNRTDLVFVRVADRAIVQTLALPRRGMSFHGILAEADGSRVWVTDSTDALWSARRDDGLWRWDEPIRLPGPNGRGASAPGGIARLGDRLLVTLSRNNTLGVVDTARRVLDREIAVGVAPYAIAVSGDVVAVSNWGGARPVEGDVTDTSSGTPTRVDPVTNVANSGTVTLLEAERLEPLAELEVGLHPNDLAVDGERGLLYVANANSDTVSVIDLGARTVARTLAVRPDARLPFGSSPNALALSPDGARLWVANGTNNAIAVLAPLAEQPIVGHLPVGWYPGAVAFDAAHERLFVANTKGVGSLHPPTGRAGHNSHDHRGSVSILTDLSAEAIAAGTRTVIATNRFAEIEERLLPPRADAAPRPVPERHGEPSVFEHVLYVIKENRTYDQVLGDVARGNGDPSLCIFGREVTPNHHALVDQFVLLDNFYCSGILSADGHQWVAEAFVTDYIEKCFGGFTRSYPYEGSDPLAYAASGFLWDNALRRGRTFRCYGEMVQAKIEPRGTFEQIWDDYVAGTGKYSITAWSHIDAVQQNLCPTFIGFPSVVSDVYRADQFLAELKGFEQRGELPHLMVMLLPNDHTAGTRPGMPTPAAAVADNDLALGRVIEGLSNSSFWPKTCVFVVQDDPQAGWDHVDGHRTVAMVVSPYTRRGGQVVSTRYSQPGMVKTIELILGLPPMNQMDLLATPMTDCFVAEPDLTPYVAVENNIPLNRLNAALDRLEGPARRDALASLELDLDEVDEADEETFNRILWHAIKGHDTAYPVGMTEGGRRR
ncbi:MAG: bifunctional YncE family protein/alkaline phosphatase family protein [Planctomycetes bacterium]|nr:bifunctional YncE family protein/alkaline phosphatase family protein [Planctomycetota bacterium]